MLPGEGQTCRSGLPVSIHQSLSANQRLRRQLHWYKKQKRKAAPFSFSLHHRSYLEEVGAFLELPQATANALLSIYTSCLNDLIPIVDGASLLRDSSNGRASRYVIRAVCLVVCKEKQASPFLRVATDGPVLTPLEFASTLFTGLEAAIQANLEADKVSKIRILALIHLYNDGPGGGDGASKYLSQAIHEAWSISLHWNIPGNTEQEECDFLWWTLRNFDRLNKPVMTAAPFMIDDTDIGIERVVPQAESYRSQLTAVSTALGDLIKSATRVYKAACRATSDDTDEFPDMEQLTQGVDYDRFHKMHKCM